MIRWLAAVLGYTFFRLPGAVLGFILGTIFDNMNAGKTRSGQSRYTRSAVTPADFELNLLSIASLVIKADGKVNQTELDYVRQYFVQAYGKERAAARPGSDRRRFGRRLPTQHGWVWHWPPSTVPTFRSVAISARALLFLPQLLLSLLLSSCCCCLSHIIRVCLCPPRVACRQFRVAMLGK